jgi:hypothetical protein
MKFLFVLCCLYSLTTWAGDSRTVDKPINKPAAKTQPPKSQFNTQIYEQDSTTQGFTAVVKIVREIQGDSQVFFEGRQGFYVLGDDSQQTQLVDSQKQHTPVQVEIDVNSRKILKVDPKK